MSHNALDINAYSEMKEVMQEVLPELLKTFNDYMPDLLIDLGKAISAKDSEQLFAVSHRMKSSSNSLGALGLATTCERIEMLGRAGSTDGADELASQLKLELDEVLAFFENELKTIS